MSALDQLMKRSVDSISSEIGRPATIVPLAISFQPSPLAAPSVASAPAVDAAAKRVAVVFNGTYTIHNTATDEHRTFSVRTQADDARFAPGKRIVALLTGPDNEEDYDGFAFVDDRGVYVWRKKQGVAGKPTSYDVFAAMIWSLATRGEVSEWFSRGYRLLMEGRCIRCNRKLTHPDSIKTGIGPECAARSK